MDNNQNEEFVDVTPDNSQMQQPMPEVQQPIQPQMQQPVQQPMTNEVQQPMNVQPNKSKLPIIVGAIIGVLVITLGVCGFLYFTNTPKLLLSKNLTKLYNNLSKSSNANDSLQKIFNSNSVSLSGNSIINFKDNTQTIGNIDNLKIDYEYIENKKDKKASLNLLSTLGDESIINMDSLMQDNKMYYTIKDVMDKYYYDEYEFVSMLEASKDTEEIEHIYNIFKDSIIDNISKSNLKESKVEISINDKDVKVKKITLEINKEFLSKVVSKFVKDIKDDDKAIDILVKSLGLEKTEINEMLDSLATSFDESIEVETMYYNMYVKGLNNVVKDELVIGEYSLACSNYQDIIEMSVSASKMKVVDIKLNQKTKKISGSLMFMLSIDGTYSDNKVDLSIKAVDGSTEINLNIENGSKEITKDKEYQYNSNIDVKVLDESQEMYSISLDSEMNVKSDVEVKDIDVSNSKSSLEMTEEEQNKISENLLNNPVISSLIESSMSSDYSYDDQSYDYTYDYDTDYDYSFDDEYSF